MSLRALAKNLRFAENYGVDMSKVDFSKVEERVEWGFEKSLMRTVARDLKTLQNLSPAKLYKIAGQLGILNTHKQVQLWERTGVLSRPQYVLEALVFDDMASTPLPAGLEGEELLAETERRMNGNDMTEEEWDRIVRPRK